MAAIQYTIEFCVSSGFESIVPFTMFFFTDFARVLENTRVPPFTSTFFDLQCGQSVGANNRMSIILALGLLEMNADRFS